MPKRTVSLKQGKEEESLTKQKKVSKSQWDIIYEKTVSETDSAYKRATLSVETDKNWKSVNIRVFIKQNDEVQYTRIGLILTIRECKLLLKKLHDHIFFSCEDREVSTTCSHTDCSFSSDKEIIKITEEYAPIHVLVSSNYFTIVKQSEKELNLNDAMQGVNGIHITKGEYRHFIRAIRKILKSEGKQ